jgi:Mg2+/Co2+ transporter CorB
VELILVIALVVLIMVSGFFSGSETGMMSLNRYRLRHLAKHHHKNAIRAQKLLKRPDRLLGMILIGNTFANILASSLATILAVRLFGDVGIALATVILTIVVLIFAEVMPKTLAAYRPEHFAFTVTLPLSLLLKLLYPIVWLINGIANGLLYPFGVRPQHRKSDMLSPDELRSVVHESTSKLHGKHRHMLLSVLDLEKITMTDCMVPRSHIIGLDLNDNWSQIMAELKRSPYSKLPVYHDELNNVVGILRLRKAIELVGQPDANKTDLEKLIEQPYFIPESTNLHQQLINFQKNARDLGLVVDEYGDVLGMVTVEDIMEEIVGEFSNVRQPTANDFTLRQPDGSYIVEGSMTVRDVNRDLQLNLPTDGPKTLSGLITEHLESIPVPATCVKIAGCPIEIIKVSDKAVKRARISPATTTLMSTH